MTDQIDLESRVFGDADHPQRPQRQLPRRRAKHPSGRDRLNPSLWDALATDPMLPLPEDSRAAQIRNLRNPMRNRTKPVLKIVCLVLIPVVTFAKRLFAPKSTSPTALDWIVPRFLDRFCSDESVDYLLRHLAIESQLINFVAVNCGADDVATVDLEPSSSSDLGQPIHGLNAVVLHDANIFNFVIDLGESETADLTAKDWDELDFSMLDLPEFRTRNPKVRRWAELDLESTLYLTILLLAIFMDHPTAERAANSFQLDEPLLGAIAELTGDPVFRTWTPVKFTNWLGFTGDPARDLHWHTIVNEYAHTRLRQMAAVVDGREMP